ncbi:response regulator transcription factor [Sphingomonas nostoxanthinifaciens]|nr:response regulator transcription factor [Sphingomonas nostoxanthinifaciens]
MSVRLLIADDHPLVLEALSLAVRKSVPGAEIDKASTVAEAEALASQRGDYRLVLLDLLLPDARGFSGLLRLQHVLGSIPIVIVTAHRRSDLIEAARALGAAGFLSKAQPLDELAEGIAAVLAGGTVFPMGTGSDRSVTEARGRLASLSGAQMRVLLALADGRLNKQIAGDLRVTEATVKAHLTVIFRKLGVNNRTQALLAMRSVLSEEREETP